MNLNHRKDMGGKVLTQIRAKHEEPASPCSSKFCDYDEVKDEAPVTIEPKEVFYCNQVPLFLYGLLDHRYTKPQSKSNSSTFGLSEGDDQIRFAGSIGVQSTRQVVRFTRAEPNAGGNFWRWKETESCIRVH